MTENILFTLTYATVFVLVYHPFTTSMPIMNAGSETSTGPVACIGLSAARKRECSREAVLLFSKL